MSMMPSAHELSSIRTVSRSRMLDAYLAAITQMLAEARFAEAERGALTLPHIAVALADPQMQSSCEGYRAWCTRWVRPEQADATYDSWFAQASCSDDDLVRGVPFAALQALRLHRLARPRPAIAMTSPELDAAAEGPEGAAIGKCLTLVNATVRWYCELAHESSQIQANLARLGALR